MNKPLNQSNTIIGLTRNFEGEDLVFINERPSRRGIFSYVIRYYSLLVAGLAFIAVLPSIVQHFQDMRFLLVMVGFFLVGSSYYLIKYVKSIKRILLNMLQSLQIRNLHSTDNKKNKYEWAWQIFRVGLLGIYFTSFLTFVYTTTDYLTTSNADTLYMIMILIPLFASRRGYSLFNFLLTQAFTIICLVTAFVFAYTVNNLLIDITTMGTTILAKALWILFLSSLIHILVRYLAELTANFRLLDDIELMIMDLHTIKSEEDLLDELVNRIAKEFDYPVVNVLHKDESGKVRVIAAASKSGLKLKRKQTLIDITGGIAELVIKNGRSYFSNDVRGDLARSLPFVEHEAFKLTRSELMVPFVIENREVTSILDIQSHKRGAFIYQDKDIMERVAKQCSQLLENIKQQNHFSKSLTSIASRLIIPSNLEAVLYEIANAAYEILEPSFVALYEYDAIESNVVQTITAGNFFQPLPKVHKIPRTSIVYKVINDGQDFYFHEDITNPTKDDAFDEILHYRDINSSVEFVNRERIQARAIIRLSAGENCVGLMFLNYRAIHKFSEREKQIIIDFANLSALAIQKSRALQQNIIYEKKEITGRLYERLSTEIEAASYFVTSLMCDNKLTEKQDTRLRMADEAINQVKKQMRYLDESFSEEKLGTLSEELYKVAKRAEDIFKISFDINWRTDRGDNVTDYLTKKVQHILNEIIHLAVIGANADSVRLFGIVEAGMLTLDVEFNGFGFELDIAKPESWRVIEQIARQGNGWSHISSTPRQQTKLKIRLPFNPFQFDQELHDEIDNKLALSKDNKREMQKSHKSKDHYQAFIV